MGKERNAELEKVRRASKPELAGNNERVEKPGTIPPLAEVSGGDWLAIELYDPSASPTELPMPVTRQRQSSPELLHPVNSDSDRFSLWQRRRGGDRRRSDAEQSRNGWPLAEGSGNSKSASSRRSFMPDVSPQIVLDDEHEILPSNYAENPISPDESNHSDRFWTFSPNLGLASPLENMLSPTSPLGQDMYPLSTTVSPSTEICDRSTSRAHEEAADGSIDRTILIGSSRLMSAPKEPSRILSPYTPHEPPIPVSTQTCQAEANAFELEGTTVPDAFDKPAESETSSLTADSIVPQVNTGILPSKCFSASPLRDLHMELNSQYKNHMLLFPNPTRPATAFHASSFSGHTNRRASIANGPTLPEMEMSDTNVDNGCETAPMTSCSFASVNTENGRVESAWITYLDDERQQPSTLHRSRDLATSQAFSVKVQPLCFNCNSFPVGSTVTKHEQVEELHDLIHIINREWMRRMEVLPELMSRCKMLPAPSLFKRAIWTLRGLIRGKLPQTFEDVFAIVHLAFAAAHLSHWQHDFYSWNALCDDALQWQHTLSIDEDRSFVTAAMSCWTFPGLDLSSLLNINHTGFGSNLPQRSLYCCDWRLYDDALRNNEVFRICIGFLDGKSILARFRCISDNSNSLIGFEGADTSERNDRFPPKELALFAQSQSRKWEVKQMISNITRPLQQRPGIEAFRSIVVEIQSQINRGLLQNTREVEVALINNGRVSLNILSPQVFRYFL